MEERKVLQEGKFFSPDEWLALRGGAYCIRKSRIISYEIVTGDTYQYVGLRCQGDVNINLLEPDAAEFMALLRAETGATYPVPRNLPKANVSTAEGAVARLASVIVAYMKERELNITVKGKKAILYSDLAGFYNARFCNDAEMRANMVGQILRDDLRLTTERTGRGWALVLVEEQILAMAERFGLELANFDF